MLKSIPTSFGIQVKSKLLEIGQTQSWLNQKCHEQTGLYVDSGRMYRILSGKSKSPRIESAIREILGMNANEGAA